MWLLQIQSLCWTRLECGLAYNGVLPVLSETYRSVSEAQGWANSRLEGRWEGFYVSAVHVSCCCGLCCDHTGQLRMYHGLTRTGALCRICSLKEMLQALRLQSQCKQVVCERTTADLDLILRKVGSRAATVSSHITCSRWRGSSWCTYVKP